MTTSTPPSHDDESPVVDLVPPRTGDAESFEVLPTPRRRGGFLVAMGVGAVLAAGIVGYTVGDRTRATPTPTPTAAPSVQPIPPAPEITLIATGTRCSSQVGRRLQLGIEIKNDGNTSLEINAVTPVFPLGRLRAVAITLGTCGQPDVGPIAGAPLAPGASLWVRTTVDVLVACPRPYPVQFDVDHSGVTGTGTGRDRRDHLGGFGDLGNVPYSGCHG